MLFFVAEKQYNSLLYILKQPARIFESIIHKYQGYIFIIHDLVNHK